MPLKDLIATPQEAAFLRALRDLKARGWSVAPADIPGLTYVGGHELTVGQVLDLARQERNRQ